MSAHARQAVGQNGFRARLSVRHHCRAAADEEFSEAALPSARETIAVRQRHLRSESLSE